MEGGWGCLYSGHHQGSRSGGPQASSHTSPSAHSRPQPPPSLISSTTGGSRGCSSSQEGPEGTEAGGEEGRQVCGFIGVPPQPQTGAPQDSKPAHPSLRPLRAEVTGKYGVWARPMGLPQARGGGGGLGHLLGAKPTLEGRTSMKQLVAGQQCTEPGGSLLVMQEASQHWAVPPLEPGPLRTRVKVTWQLVGAPARSRAPLGITGLVPPTLSGGHGTVSP